jgi:hypothetical protein
MKIRTTNKDGDYRYKTKFLWWPQLFQDEWIWLETVTIRQMYIDDEVFWPRWVNICLSNPESGLPTSIHPIGSSLDEPQESIESTVQRFIERGVYQNKITTTNNLSVVIWSKTRKCLVGGKDQPDPLEVVYDDNNKPIATYDNNVTISLQNRSELTEFDVKKINESEGIIVTNATYGKPYFRFGFIPN